MLEEHKIFASVNEIPSGWMEKVRVEKPLIVTILPEDNNALQIEADCHVDEEGRVQVWSLSIFNVSRQLLVLSRSK